MFRPLVLLCLVMLGLAACAILPVAPLAPGEEPAPQDLPAGETCAVTTPIQAEPPDDPNADPFGFGPWVVNADRTIWVGLRTDGGWRTGGEKVLWIRPAGAELVVSGQRLDDKAPPLRAEIPCCYPTSFQVTGLYFPSEGCWEVTANAGAHELRFITRVRTGDEANKVGVQHDSPLAGAVLLQTCGDATCRLHLIDPDTGQRVPGYDPIHLGSYAQYTYSHDRRILALLVYEQPGAGNDQYMDGVLQFVDLATWRTTTTSLTFNSIYDVIKFSPDDRRLWLVSDQSSWPPSKQGHLVDVARGVLLAERRLDILPTHTEFTPDGAQLMLYGTDNGTEQNGLNPTTAVALLATDDLHTLWQQTVPDLRNGQFADTPLNNPHDAIWWQPAVSFAPDGATLYIVHADRDALSTVDFRQHTVQTRQIGQPQSWFEQVLTRTARTAYAKVVNGTSRQAAISADGARLFVIGLRRSVNEGIAVETPLGVQVIDLARGVEIAHLDTQTQVLRLSPGGSQLYLHGWQQTGAQTREWTEVFDAQTFQPITRLDGKSIVATQRLDGRPILLSQVLLPDGQTELATLDPVSFAVIQSWNDRYSGYVGWWIVPG